MKIHGDVLRSSPNPRRYPLDQGFVQLGFQLRQLFHADLFIDIVPNRLRVWGPYQVGTDGFDGAPIGRHPQQDSIQVVTAALVPIGLQFKLLAEHHLRLTQHFLIRQCQVIFLHWAFLLAVIVFFNPLRISQAHYFSVIFSFNL